ncbi:hypothetical protein [Vibrio penaeicida]|uniref:hypothetical protein n=1 Tax=Vibrio penaeicida TaxID=104609 RepID=UPI001CC44241|nr:hypothetical protein [Vibrio penaeicida]
MQFEYNSKTYNFERVYDDYLTGEEHTRSYGGRFDTHENLIEKTVRNDLFVVTYKEKETGLIINTQAGIELDLSEGGYVNSGDDVFTGGLAMNTSIQFHPEVNFDYSGFDLPDSVEDEFDFENAFEEAANKQAYIDLEHKISYDKIPELEEHLSNKSETMKRNKRQRRTFR